jgi:hypothetical protein
LRLHSRRWSTKSRSPEELLGPDPRLDAEKREQRALDPAPLLGIGDVGGERLGDLCPCRGLVIGLEQPAAAADHLAERPERDAVAIGRAAAVMPPDRLDQAVDVFEELPGEAGLADAGRTDDADEPRPLLAAGRMEEVLEEAELVGAPDERRLERIRSIAATALGDDPDGAPGGDRARLALEHVLACRLEHDRLRGGALGCLADEDSAGRRHRLHARCGVDEVARDHPLADRTDRDCGLARQDAGPSLDGGPERPDGVDELERGSDRALRVVLVGDRGSPYRHDRVADELLDRPAIPADDVPCEIEVARQRVADVLGVTALSERGEPDEIREEDADDAALRDVARGRGG